MSYPRNAATPKAVTVGRITLIADGSVVVAGASVRVNLDGGGWGAGGGTLAYDATGEVATYAPIQAETNGDVLQIAVYKAACIGCSATVMMDLQAGDNFTLLGTAVSLDSGAATIGGMLTKMADDSGGSAFDATTDSLNKIEASIVAGFPTNDHADVEPGGGSITTGSNIDNDSDSTWTDDGAYWQVQVASSVDGNGFGLDVRQVFSLGTTKHASTLQVNAKESCQGVVHVWAYDYIAAAYERISDAGNAISGSSDKTYLYTLLADHQQSADGEVRLRFTSTDSNGSRYLYLDTVTISSVSVSGLTADEIAQAVWEHPITETAIEFSSGYFLRTTKALVTDVATADTAISFTLTAGLAEDDIYNGMGVMVEDETDDHYEVRRVADWTSGRVITLDRALGFTPEAGDHVYLMATGYTETMRGTDSAALATALTTAQNDLDKLTGTDGATLATAQANYAPSKAGDAMTLTEATHQALERSMRLGTKIIHVSKAGNDGTGDGTAMKPYLTMSKVETELADGDTVMGVGAGTWTEQFSTLGHTGVELILSAAAVLTSASDPVLTLTAGCRYSGGLVEQTGATGVAVYADANDVIVGHPDRFTHIVSLEDGVAITATTGYAIVGNVLIESGRMGIGITGAQILIQDVTIYCSTDTSETAWDGIICEDSTNTRMFTMRNTHIFLNVPDNSNIDTCDALRLRIVATGVALIENSTLSVVTAGDDVCRGLSITSGRVFIRNSRAFTSSSGTNYDLHNGGGGATLHVDGTVYNTSSGTITHVKPLAAILADTGELQTNQGDWATATGFATATALTTHNSDIISALTSVTTLKNLVVEGTNIVVEDAS